MKNLFLIAFILAACHKEDLKQKETIPDNIVFGHYYGECFGSHCILIYKLTPTQLYGDQNHQYPNSTSTYVGNYTLLSDSLFEKVKRLSTKIPKELLSDTRRIIGQPDAGDWGGIYFEISTDGKSQFCLIDEMKSNLPAYLPPFVDEIERNIGLINN